MQGFCIGLDDAVGAIAALSAFAGLALNGAAASGATVGATAPAFEVVDANNRPRR